MVQTLIWWCWNGIFSCRVVFPEILNLNSVIVSAGNKEDSDGIPEESVVKCDDSSTTDSGSALDDESCQGTETVLSTQDADYQVNLLCYMFCMTSMWSVHRQIQQWFQSSDHCFFIQRVVVCVCLLLCLCPLYICAHARTHSVILQMWSFL